MFKRIIIIFLCSISSLTIAMDKSDKPMAHQTPEELVNKLDPSNRELRNTVQQDLSDLDTLFKKRLKEEKPTHYAIETVEGGSLASSINLNINQELLEAFLRTIQDSVTLYNITKSKENPNENEENSLKGLLTFKSFFQSIKNANTAEEKEERQKELAAFVLKNRYNFTQTSKNSQHNSLEEKKS